MPIYIKESPEPFAGAPIGGQVILAESSAYVRLCNELMRYVSGQITGRSFLISGHRGAGKTTLVLKAIEDTTSKVLYLTGTRPLLIPLHGPDLLTPPGRSAGRPGKAGEGNAQGEKPAGGDAAVAAKAGEANGGGGKSPEAGTAAAVMEDTEEFLRQVTIGIYRALADLFHLAYWRVAQWKASTKAPKWRDLPEMAAQLRIELDGAPDLRLLREYWKKADALEEGILPQARFDLPVGMQPPPLPPGAAARDRGMLELVALASAAQAYKVVRGRLETKEGSKQDDTSKSSLAFQTVGEVKNLLNPLLGALAGGAVGLGLKSAEVSGLVAALAGTATGLGTAVTLNFSSSRSRENTRTTEVTFLPDTTIASLDRTLPLLVNRCRHAGVAPVFVVDELDKVRQLAKRMGPLVRHLKSLVTEKTFFCFLADRSYLEGLRRMLVATPYRTEYTYFSDRLFVLYRPSDMHKYLGQLLETRKLPDVTDHNDQIDLEVLPYVLLHRSRMHPFDLRRQLARMRGSDGAISLSPGAVRTNLAYRFDVLIQVAVEWLLEQPELQDRLSQDEDFTQLIYDTLYYPSRMWEQGATELDVSRETFFSYLAQRMSPTLGAEKEEDEVAEQSAREEQNNAENSKGAECPLSDLDKDFLFARLRELLGFVKEPARLRLVITEGNAKRFPTSVLEAIPTDAKFKLLEEKAKDVYVWRRDLFGRSVEPPGVEAVVGDVEPKEKFIQEVQAALNEIGPKVNLDRLAAEYNVLSATPAWNSVQQALRRLKRLGGEGRPEPYPEMEADANAVWEFSQMLQGSGRALAEALVAAQVLGQVGIGDLTLSGGNIRESKILLGLAVLTSRLGLRELSIGETNEKLHRAMEELKGAFSWFAFKEESFDFTLVTVKDWVVALQAALNQPQLATLNRSTADLFTAGVETKWQERFTQYFHDGTTVFEPTAGDLICGATLTDLSALLSLNLSEVSLGNWSDLLLWAWADILPFARTTSPAFAIPALFHLGFRKAAFDAMQSGHMFDAAFMPPSKFQKFQESRDQIQDWMWARPGGAESERPGVVVVQDYGSGMGSDWKPSSKYAAVMVTADKLMALRQALQLVWSPTLISRVVVEVTPNPNLMPQVQFPPPQLGMFPELMGLPYNYVSRTAPTGPVPSGTPLVVSPKTLDEAVIELPSAGPQPMPNAPPA